MQSKKRKYDSLDEFMKAHLGPAKFELWQLAMAEYDKLISQGNID
tara:strand:- start:289 stop:423 length:135 start_codon:yes stop_codon:yes gene_type:complete